LALVTDKLRSTSTYDENKQAISANTKPASWSSSRTNSENNKKEILVFLGFPGPFKGPITLP